MINEPAVDVLIRDLGTEEEPVSRYALCVVASKRARQIIEAEKSRGIRDFTGMDKELLTACKDIAEGKVVIALPRFDRGNPCFWTSEKKGALRGVSDHFYGEKSG